MNELHLFAGAGGGILGSVLLGHKIVGAVEWEDYPCQVLDRRQRDGLLPKFPIWNMDIGEFNARIAPLYGGVVDIISGGFPCQPYSSASAGYGKGELDERNMWPQTMECIRVIRPRFAFLENVADLCAKGYIRRIFGDLAEAGYDAQWIVLGADDCGAPHIRKRLWILAYSHNQGELLRILNAKVEMRPTLYGDVWASKPDESGMDDGMAHRMVRFKAIGNAQVPIVAATAWKILSGLK
jgi:DNA (cytosine-5)-methyltransferase 1